MDYYPGKKGEEPFCSRFKRISLVALDLSLITKRKRWSLLDSSTTNQIIRTRDM